MKLSLSKKSVWRINLVIALVIFGFLMWGRTVISVEEVDNLGDIETLALVSQKTESGLRIHRINDGAVQEISGKWLVSFISPFSLITVGSNEEKPDEQHMAYVASFEESFNYEVSNLSGYIVNITTDESRKFMLINGVDAQTGKGYLCSVEIYDKSLKSCKSIVEDILGEEENIEDQKFQARWNNYRNRPARLRITELSFPGRQWEYEPTRSGEKLSLIGDAETNEAYLLVEKDRFLKDMKIKTVGPIVVFHDTKKVRHIFGLYFGETFMPIDDNYGLIFNEFGVDMLDIQQKKRSRWQDDIIQSDDIQVYHFQRLGLQ